MLEHLPSFAELAQHRPQLEANLEGLLQRGLALRYRLEDTQRLLQSGPGVQESSPRGSLPSSLPEILHCLLPQLAPDCVMGEPLDLVAQPVGVKLFQGINDARVDVAATFVEQPAICDLVREGVLEGILQVGE